MWMSHFLNLNPLFRNQRMKWDTSYSLISLVSNGRTPVHRPPLTSRFHAAMTAYLPRQASFSIRINWFIASFHLRINHRSSCGLRLLILRCSHRKALLNSMPQILGISMTMNLLSHGQVASMAIFWHLAQGKVKGLKINTM